MLRNFKGLKKYEVDFNGETSLYGTNGSGKTTIMDAYHWLLFGKDSQDRQNFNIKTLDEDNNPIHKLEHEVEGVFEHENKEFTLRRTFKERWVKKRGATEAEFSGHETDFHINDVPKKKEEYNAYINKIVSEDVFKMVSHPLYFSSLRWDKQREILFEMAGQVSDEVIAGDETKYRELLATIAQKDTTLSEYKRELAERKKKIKKELESIPARIDENDRDKPEPKDWDALRSDLAKVQEEIEQLDNEISSQSKQSEAVMKAIESTQAELYKAQTKRGELFQEAQREADKDITEAKERKRKLEQSLIEDKNTLSSKVMFLKEVENRIEKFEEEAEQLRQKYKDRAAQEINQDSLACPTCGTEYKKDKIETIIADFNSRKANNLAEINKQGAEKVALIEQEKENLEKHREESKQIEASIHTLEQQLSDIKIPEQHDVRFDEIPGVAEVDIQIKDLKEQLATQAKPSNTDETLKVKRRELSAKADSLKSELSDFDKIVKADKRIKELEQKQKELAQELADVEGVEMTIQSFNRAKITAIEDNVNSMFKVVRFKLFQDQINGGEQEICEAMVEGVPWSDLNTAMRINAGIDIINALSSHFGFHAPIWVDNRESIINLVATETQVINLIVSKEHKTLKVA